jgi:flagellar basal body-associated protein FliL
MEEYSEKTQKRGIGKKILTTLSIIIVLAAAAFVFFKFFFVFGTGVKAGELNLFVYKGYVFKTYEGRLIQAGYNSKNSNATIQSNEFNFSVKDKKVAEQLERCAGKVVELHYKEYLGTLPWRGMTKYVVDSVYSVSKTNEPIELPVTVPTEVL